MTKILKGTIYNNHCIILSKDKLSAWNYDCIGRLYENVVIDWMSKIVYKSSIFVSNQDKWLWHFDPWNRYVIIGVFGGSNGHVLPYTFMVQGREEKYREEYQYVVMTKQDLENLKMEIWWYCLHEIGFKRKEYLILC